ncbi:MAG: aspartate aminotransferase family protein [Halobacteriaceae archaeon]
MTDADDSAAARERMARARESIPGGVNSFARYVDRPLAFDRARGSHLYDVDGEEYVDYVSAWGAVVLGHCHPTVDEAVDEATADSDLVGLGATEHEVALAELVCEHVPSADRVHFGNTGSEVVAHAVRLARAVTGRSKVIKFEGHYHGWYDPVAVNFHGDAADVERTTPISAGIPGSNVADTVPLPFNDVEAVEAAVAEHADDVAALILEPVAFNMGCVTPEDGFLRELRRITEEHGIVLIFDEIITGFRTAMGGVQAREGVTPDLTTLGKSMGNGYPISAVAGTRELMEEFVTAGGDVAFGGTYNGHTASMAAGRAVLETLAEGDFHETATARRETITDGLNDIIEDAGLTAHATGYGPVFLTYFMDPPVRRYRDILAHNDDERLMDYRWEMIDRNVLLTPMNVRRNYLTASHTDADVERTLEAAKAAVEAVSD